MGDGLGRPQTGREKMNTPQRTDIVDTISARTAIEALVADLRKYAEWEFDQEPLTAGQNAYRRNRRDSLLFAADYIEKAL